MKKNKSPGSTKSQVAANPWHQEEEERDTNQHARKKKKNTRPVPRTPHPLSPSHKRGDRNIKTLRKYIENFTTQKWKLSGEKFW